MRPIAALARDPPPLNTDSAVAMPSSSTIGPDTIGNGQQLCVVHTTPRRLNVWTPIASTVVQMTGMCSGRAAGHRGVRCDHLDGGHAVTRDG